MNNNFTVERTFIEGLLLIHTKVYRDNRGFFVETFSERSFAELGLSVRFVQDNRSRSCCGTLRGLHFQRTHPQGKLVGVTSGSVFDVAVDLRRSSETYGRWFGVTLSGEDGTLFYVPPGFAHGFCVLSETADFTYKCTDFYEPADEDGLLWCDETVGVDWPIKDPSKIVLSEKDGRYPTFDRAFSYE